MTFGFRENFSSASEVGGSCALSAGDDRRIGAPTVNACASAGAFAASARTPGSRSLNRPVELTRNGRILGSVSIVVCSVATPLVIESWMYGRATVARAPKV